MWLIWLAIAVLAAVGEMMTTGLFLATIAAAAAITAVLAFFFGASVIAIALQVAIFGAISLAGIAVFRPFVVHALGMDVAQQISGPVFHSRLSGKRAVVTQTVDSHGGQIRIGQSEFWTARSFDPDVVIPAGRTVEIVLIDGITALVEPVAPAASLESIDVPSQKGM